MQEQGVKSVYVLNDKEAYGLGVANNLRNAAEHLGIKIAGFEAWDPKQSSYEGLFRKIGYRHPDPWVLGVFLSPSLMTRPNAWFTKASFSYWG